MGTLIGQGMMKWSLSYFLSPLVLKTYFLFNALSCVLKFNAFVVFHFLYWNLSAGRELWSDYRWVQIIQSVSSFPLSICVFFLFVYVSVPMRAGSEVLSYSHVFKESFPLGREAVLLAELVILDDKGAVDAHLTGQISKSTWFHGESPILWSSVLFS